MEKKNIKPSGYWNVYENCKNEALKYDNIKEFANKCSAAYHVIRRNNWYDELFSHMIKKHETWTIEKCKIDRKDLNDNRRTLLNIFREHIRVALIEYPRAEEQEVAIATIVRSFIIDSKNIELEFLAFRRYAISSGWLNEIIKEMN